MNNKQNELEQSKNEKIIHPPRQLNFKCDIISQGK